MRKHTRGPWVWSGNALQAGEPCNRTNVVSIRTDGHGFHFLSVSNDDRALIQNAPEMLGALKRALDYIGPYKGGETVVQHLQFVIAKAEGRDQ